MKPAAILFFFPTGSNGLGLFRSGLNGVPEKYHAKFRSSTKRGNVRGPDGRGILITWQENVLIDYDPDLQDWRKVGDYWIGTRKDYQPAEFSKADTSGRLPAGGYPVTMGDGREYIIPVALADAPNFRIPWRETLNENGDILRECDPRYEAVCYAAQILWRHISEDAEFAMDEDELRLACATAISVNYRLDMDDCLALGLFSSESYQAIVGAILDLPAMDELLKKKALERESIGSGATDS